MPPANVLGRTPAQLVAIAFLMTRVRAPDKDDWTKLVRLMKYLRGTRTLVPLILSANGSGILKWWVGASFAVHPNMRDQIMGVIPAWDPGPGKAKPRKGELNTHKVKPRNRAKKVWSRRHTSGPTGKSVVPPAHERYHRSVLGEVSKRMKDGHKKDGCF
jgi:hypothetical protein